MLILNKINHDDIWGTFVRSHEPEQVPIQHTIALPKRVNKANDIARGKMLLIPPQPEWRYSSKALLIYVIGKVYIRSINCTRNTIFTVTREARVKGGWCLREGF